MNPVLSLLASVLCAGPGASLHPVKAVDVAPGGLRLARGVAGSVPAQAFRLALGRRQYLLFDLDGDGAVTSGSGDGIALEGQPWVVALAEPWWCEAGQGRLVVDLRTERAMFAPVGVGVEPGLLADAADVNEVRLRAGLPLLAVDASLSRACEKHCDFLKRNGLLLAWKGGMVHFENPKLPGFSAEGQAAGWGSSIQVGAASYREAVASWSSTVWHAIPMLDPALGRCGVALRHGVAMFYPASGREEAPLAGPCAHPPDGARDVPRFFSVAGEDPSPVAGDTRRGAGSGFPVIVRLPAEWRAAKLVSFTLTDERGGTVAGHASAPSKPAHAKRAPGNQGCAVFLPTRPLTSKHTYRAHLELEGCDPLVWSFTTGTR
jgi:hypothetical protein